MGRKDGEVTGEETNRAPAQRQPSPVLSSNNPFRNRTVSPQNVPLSPNTVPPERPTSRNPFLDQPSKKDQVNVSVRPVSPERGVPSRSPGHSPAKREFSRRVPRRGENIPPRTRPRAPGHQASLSEEDDSFVKPRRVADTLDIFADPPTAAQPRPRPRRNSDSSVSSKTLADDRRRDRLREKDRHARAKGKKPTARLDVIDSLDVTSIYGRGLFHHDGPFDACNPDRNRKGSRRAPMEAFAVGSANNTIGGSGPVKKNLDVTQYHGQGAEGFTDFSTSGSHNPLIAPVSFDTDSGSMATARTGQGVKTFQPIGTTEIIPNNRATLLHGQETLGLGTSTFLEGTPAARTAIQRREGEADHESSMPNAGGLGRKRSLAQKIRGISNPSRPLPRQSDALNIPEPRTLTREESQSAGGMPRINEKKPFFNDYNDKSLDRRGSIGGGEEEINAEARAHTNRSRALSSPKKPLASNALQRSITSDGNPADGHQPVRARNRQASVTAEPVKPRPRQGSTAADPPKSTAAPSTGGGFINRVKSLKGRRK